MTLGVFQQLPGDGGHAAGIGHALPLDQREGAHGIPFRHEHQRAAAGDGRHQRRHARGHVEHRHHVQPHRLRRFRRRLLATAQQGALGQVAGGEDAAQDVAVRAERALGQARGAAGVEDGRVVVRRDVGVRQVGVGQHRVGVRRADQRLQRHGRCLRRVVRPGHDHVAQQRQLARMRSHPVPPLGVAQQHAAFGLGQPVAQLAAGPPRVQRHHDGAKAGGGEERHRPFGQVAHRQGHAVALGHAALAQCRGQGGGGAEPSVVGHPLVLVDDEQALRVGLPRQAREHRQARRLVFPHAGGHAPDRDRLDLHRLARAAQPLLDLGQRGSGPGPCRRAACGLVRRHGLRPKQGLPVRDGVAGYRRCRTRSRRAAAKQGSGPTRRRWRGHDDHRSLTPGNRLPDPAGRGAFEATVWTRRRNLASTSRMSGSPKPCLGTRRTRARAIG